MRFARSFRASMSGAAIGRPRSDELEQDHLGGVGLARAEVEDARVAARTLDVAWGDLLEQLVDKELVLADRVQRRLGLLEQVANRLHAGALEAVVRADPELELLDQDVVHGVRRARARRCDVDVVYALAVAAALDLLEPVGVGEDREALDED